MQVGWRGWEYLTHTGLTEHSPLWPMDFLKTSHVSYSLRYFPLGIHSLLNDTLYRIRTTVSGFRVLHMTEVLARGAVGGGRGISRLPQSTSLWIFVPRPQEVPWNVSCTCVWTEIKDVRSGEGRVQLFVRVLSLPPSLLSTGYWLLTEGISLHRSGLCYSKRQLYDPVHLSLSSPSPFSCLSSAGCD